MKSFWQRLKAAFLRKAGRSRRRPPHHRTRPTFDVLESRLVPTTWTVNSTAAGSTGTGNSGTLAFCVSGANTDAAAGTLDQILFSVGSSATITLSSPLTFTAATGSGGIIINAASASITITDAGSQIFSVSAGATLSLQNLTFTGEVTSSYGGGGGGGGGFGGGGGASITTFSLSTVSNSSNGGAIYNDGNLGISNCLFWGNATSADGGALYNDTTGNVLITGSNFGELTSTSGLESDNSPEFDSNYVTSGTSDGGAIYNAGSMTIQNSSLLGNFVYAGASSFGVGDGAGIYNAASAFMTINNSTIADNTAGSNEVSGGGGGGGGGGDVNTGGGVYNNGTMTVTESTVYGNRVFFTGDRTGNMEGSGFYNDTAGTLFISSSTIANNNGGIANVNTSTSAVTLMNSIVYGNLHVVSPYEETDLDGVFSSASAYNLIGDISVNADGAATGITNGVNNNQVGTYVPSGGGGFGGTTTYTPTLNPYLLEIGDYPGQSPTSNTATMPIISGTPASPAVGTGGAITTLTTSLSPSSSTLTLATPAAVAVTFGAEYILEIDSEEMIVTLASGSTFNIQARGYGGTTAASHNSGVGVNFAEYQNSDNRITSTGTTDIGAAEDCTFTFTTAPPGSIGVNANFPVVVTASVNETAALLPDVPITIGLNQISGSGTLSGTLDGYTASNGALTYSPLAISAVGTYSITASMVAVGALGASQNGLGNGGTTTTPISITSGDIIVSNLPSVAISGPTGSLAAGSTLTPAPAVTLTSGGSPFAGAASVVLSLSTNSSGTASSVNFATGTSTLTLGTSGVYTFSGMTVDVPGTYYLTATVTVSSGSGTATATTTSPFVVTAGTPFGSNITFVQEPESTVTAGVSISPAVTVKVEDQYGNPVGSAPVTLSITGGSPTLMGTVSATTGANGIATFSSLKVDQAGGPDTLTAVTEGVTGSTASSPFTVTAAGAKTLQYIVQPSTSSPITAATGDLDNLVEVEAFDLFNNPVPNATINLALSKNAFAAGSTTSVATSSTGTYLAIFSNLAVTTAASYTLTASSSGATSLVSNAFTISAGTPVGLILSQPSNAKAGAALTSGGSSPVTVKAVDLFNNTVSLSTASLSLSPSSGTLNNAGTFTLNNGVATFSSLSIDQANTYTLTASADSMTTTSSQFIISSTGVAASLQFVTQPTPPPGSPVTTITAASGDLDSLVSVEAFDQYQNPVANISVTLKLSSNTFTTGATTASATTASSGANFGDAVYPSLAVTTAASYTLTASATGASSITSNSFIIAADVADAMLVLSQPNNAKAGATLTTGTSSGPITVKEVDPFKNVIPLSTASLSLSPSSGSLNNASTFTVSNGVVTFSSLSINRANSYTMTATSGALSATSNTFIISSTGVASLLSFTAQPTPNGYTSDTQILAAVGDLNNEFTVEATDTYGNPVPDITVTLTLSKNKFSSGTTTVSAKTGGAGLAQYPTLTLPTIATSYTVTASASAVSSHPVANPFDIILGNPAKIVFINPPKNTNQGNIIDPTSGVIVEVEDGVGNPEPNVAVAVSLSSGSLYTVDSPNPVTGSNGKATFSNLSIRTPGTYNLLVTAPGTTVAGSFSSSPFNIIGVPTSLEFSQVVNDGPNVPQAPLAVQVLDRYDNPLLTSGIYVSVSVESGPGSVRGIVRLATNSQGQAIFSSLSYSLVGYYVLEATSPSLLAGFSSPFEISAIPVRWG